MVAEQMIAPNLKRNILSREARAVEVGEVNAAKDEIGQHNAANRVCGDAARVKHGKYGMGDFQRARQRQ